MRCVRFVAGASRWLQLIKLAVDHFLEMPDYYLHAFSLQ